VHRDRGFSLIEMIIAMGITAAVVGTLFAIVQPAQGAFDTRLEVADMQQRLRVAVDALSRDLAMAGAGAYAGGRAGPLIRSFAPVLPFRQGPSRDEAPGPFRTDAITIISVPATAAQTTLAADLAPASLTLLAAPGPACAAGTNLCGFAPGMTVAVFDDTGNVDTFTIAAVFDGPAQLTLAARPADSSGTTYARGSTVVEARLHTYYLKVDAAAQTSQLMHSDGSGADVPVVDHLVGIAFDYAGEPRPPALSAAGTSSYGPAPPAPGTRTSGYPAGENCVFQIDETTGQHVPRLAPLSASATLTPLSAAQLTDGPWCPDEASGNRWDADLLRVRTIGITLRVEAALSALRGPAGTLFANAGTARNANRWAPDLEMRIQVSPRNMNVGRR
jgi:prepilin-type N-terminal cleavage/methylation domain-containing protein